MAMTISARSVEGQRESPRIKLLTMKSVSLLKTRFDGLLKLQKKLLRLCIVTHADLHSRASGEDKRETRQK